MEDNKKSRGISLAALIVAIVSLAIGFAAYTSSLTIESGATYTPNQEDFVVKFSPDETGENPSTTVEPKTKNPDELDASNATIDNSDKSKPKIKGLHANFTAPGQSVTYEFYVYNDSPYIVYLRNIMFENATGAEETKKCEANSGKQNPLVTAACADISVKVEVGDSNKVTANGTVASVAPTHSLSSKTAEKIVVTIEYANNNNVADEGFEVTFGNIILNYSTAEKDI